MRNEIQERTAQREQIRADREAVQMLSESAASLVDPPDAVKRRVLDSLSIKVRVNEDTTLDISGLITDRVLSTIITYEMVVTPIREQLGYMPDTITWATEDGSEGPTIWNGTRQELFDRTIGPLRTAHSLLQPSAVEGQVNVQSNGLF